MTKDKSPFPKARHAIALSLLLTTAATYSLGLGGMFYATPALYLGDIAECDKSAAAISVGTNFSLCGEYLPFVFLVGAEYDILQESADIQAAFDFPFYRYQKGLFGCYLALGPAVGSTIERDCDATYATLNLSGRISACFYWERYDGFLEPFIDIAAQPLFSFDFKHSECDFQLRFPIGFGFRIWD